MQSRKRVMIWGGVLLAGLVLAGIFMQRLYAPPLNTAEHFVNAVQANNPSALRSLMMAQKWAPVFDEDPAGLLSESSSAEPNLVFLAGKPFEVALIEQSGPVPLAIGVPCDRWLLCPEFARVNYRLTFEAERYRPWLFPVALMYGGRLRQNMSEATFRSYVDNPAEEGRFMLSRRLRPEPVAVALPQSVGNYKPDVSRMDFVTASRFDPKAVGYVVSHKGRKLETSALADLLPRLSTIILAIELQRPHPLAGWKVSALMLDEPEVVLHQGGTVPLPE